MLLLKNYRVSLITRFSFFDFSSKLVGCFSSQSDLLCQAFGQKAGEKSREKVSERKQGFLWQFSYCVGAWNRVQTDASIPRARLAAFPLAIRVVRVQLNSRKVIHSLHSADFPIKKRKPRPR